MNIDEVIDLAEQKNKKTTAKTTAKKTETKSAKSSGKKTETKPAEKAVKKETTKVSAKPARFGDSLLDEVILLLIIVIRFDASRLGIGTLANMILVGYVAEFFMEMIARVPVFESLSLMARLVIFVPTLALFLVAASTYMCVDMGVAPYDAIPQIIAAKKGWSFRVVRTCWDFVMMVGGALLGATAGPVSVGITLFIGSLVAWMSVYVRRFFD